MVRLNGLFGAGSQLASYSEKLGTTTMLPELAILLP
jgi:hypothetical protein